MDGMGRDRVGMELRHGWDVDGIGVRQGDTGVRFGVDYGFSVIIMVISRNVRIIIISSIVIIHLIININGKKKSSRKKVLLKVKITNYY